ncbi:MAG: PEP-utilizing enzyme, partial [Acidimicrobiia bacterium]
IERQYFGMVVSEEADNPEKTSGGIRALLPVMRAAGLRRRLRIEAPLVIAAVDEVVAAGVDVAAMEPDVLLGYRNRVRELAARVITAEAQVAATAAASFRGLELFLERYIGGEAAEWAQRLTAGSIAAAGTLAAVDLDEIMTAIEEHPNLGDLLNEREPQRSDVEVQDGGDEMLAAFDRALARSGSAAIYGGPTWAENDRSAWQLVCRNFLAGGPERVDQAQRSLTALVERLTGTRKWKVTRIMTGQIVDMRIRLLRGLVRDTVDFLSMRETTKRALLRLGGEERRIALVMADSLVAAGVLEDRRDVVLLSDGELERAYRGESIDPGVVAARRRDLQRAEAIGPLPLRFEGYPGAVHVELDGSDHLQGWGASPGRHTGRPVVIRDLATADIQPGDILVAHSTDPSWTPLFLIAGAIVVEEGGPLSHAAIVARELGLPAVLHIAGAVQLLDGVTEVTVDGTAGTVVIHDGSEPVVGDKTMESAAA